MNNFLISPSILAADPLRIHEEVKKIELAGADWHHIDVMDGHFVPNLTFGIPLIKALKKVVQKPLDVHIMISNPDLYVEEYIKAGADLLTFHAEASVHSHRLAQKVRSLGRKVGVAINPGTSIECILPLLEEIDLVMIMSVNPGFGGQEFIKGAVQKIGRLKAELISRNLDKKVQIEVDGGINDKTAKEVVEAGASVLVAGSYIYGSKDYKQAINNLRNFCV